MNIKKLQTAEEAGLKFVKTIDLTRMLAVKERYIRYCQIDPHEQLGPIEDTEERIEAIKAELATRAEQTKVRAAQKRVDKLEAQRKAELAKLEAVRRRGGL